MTLLLQFLGTSLPFFLLPSSGSCASALRKSTSDWEKRKNAQLTSWLPLGAGFHMHLHCCLFWLNAPRFLVLLVLTAFFLSFFFAAFLLVLQHFSLSLCIFSLSWGVFCSHSGLLLFSLATCTSAVSGPHPPCIAPCTILVKFTDDAYNVLMTVQWHPICIHVLWVCDISR